MTTKKKEKFLKGKKVEFTKRPYFIGIAGGTGSGKTLLAKKLAAVDPDNVLILEHDAYYKSRAKVTPYDHNFDYPGALDNKLLLKHLRDLFAEKPINIPVYDFLKHKRTSKTKKAWPKPIIILEGIFALESEILRSFMNLKIFIDIEADIRLTYRLVRDVEERGYTLRGAIDYYKKIVHPMHTRWIEPTKQYADIIITNNEGDFIISADVLVPKVKEELKKRLKS